MQKLIDGENAFDKIQHPFMRIEGNFLNLIKNICQKPTAKIILNGEKLRAFLLRSERR